MGKWVWMRCGCGPHQPTFFFHLQSIIADIDPLSSSLPYPSQASVPSLAMEEVLPVSVAPGDTLAPEEVFKSKQGADVKAEGEMSREERKRRRAKVREMKRGRCY